MNELTSKINEILSSEEGMNQVRNLANSLGLSLPENLNLPQTGQNQMNPAPQTNPLSQSPAANPPAVKNENPAPNNLAGGLSISPDMLLNIGKMMSSAGENDKNTALLLALKDHLSEERRRKVDDAIKIMHLVKILPVIKEMGFFGGDKK